MHVCLFMYATVGDPLGGCGRNKGTRSKHQLDLNLSASFFLFCFSSFFVLSHSFLLSSPSVLRGSHSAASNRMPPTLRHLLPLSPRFLNYQKGVRRKATILSVTSADTSLFASVSSSPSHPLSLPRARTRFSRHGRLH